MNTDIRFTRPSQITAHNQSASARELAKLEAQWAREEIAGRVMTNLAGVALALSLAFAGVWIAVTFAPEFGTQPSAGYVPGAEAGHVI